MTSREMPSPEMPGPEMSAEPTLFHLAAAIAGAGAKIAQQRRRIARGVEGPEARESLSALELMQMQLGRLERHCLAMAARQRGPLQ